MKKLNDYELKQVYGGASIWAILGSIAAVIFGIGVLDGYARPYNCR